MTDVPLTLRRSPGRPSRISSEQVVAAAIELLEADGLADFAMAKVAKAIGVSVMALYTYFPSRGALLDAAAESIFAGFDTPAPGEDWETVVRNWIETLHRGFARRPIALRLIKWDEHLSPAWIRVWLPMVRTLASEGLSGERLLFACSWLSGAVMGAIQADVASVETSMLQALVGQAGLSRTDDALLAELARDHDPAQRRAVFAFQVDTMLRSLALLLTGEAGPPRSVRPTGAVAGTSAKG